MPTTTSPLVEALLSAQGPHGSVISPDLSGQAAALALTRLGENWEAWLGAEHRPITDLAGVYEDAEGVILEIRRALRALAREHHIPTQAARLRVAVRRRSRGSIMTGITAYDDFIGPSKSAALMQFGDRLEATGDAGLARYAVQLDGGQIAYVHKDVDGDETPYSGIVLRQRHVEMLEPLGSQDAAIDWLHHQACQIGPAWLFASTEFATK